MARPREFDRTEALDKAMQLFWKNGYADTSVGDLVEFTGVNRHSLYAEFGNKWDLFSEALDFYMEGSISMRTAALRTPDASWPNIVEFFEQFVHASALPEAKYGCFMCNTGAELAAVNSQASQKFEEFQSLIRALLQEALERAQRNGEVAASLDPAGTANFLLSVVVGLSVTIKTKIGRTTILHTVQHALQSVPIPN